VEHRIRHQHEGVTVRTVIVRLAEPEQTGGTLHGLVEVIGEDPVPFSGADALIDLISAAAWRPARPKSTGTDAEHVDPA
jgi:hypothetical protein